MHNKYFFVTIDTEADNQWDKNHECSTNNAKYLPRFQELAEKYNFKPVWLTTYEMANDSFFVDYFKEKQNRNLCEIGMHLHAWNTPPDYNLNTQTDERSYLIEYPINIMEKKIKNLDELLTNKFNKKPISHRAGRWAMNNDYFKLLSKYGYKIDCSVTPHVNWKSQLGESGIPGSNYEKCPEKDYYINNKILEMPVTIRKIHIFDLNRIKNIKNFCGETIRFIKGRNQWIRPDNTFSAIGIKKIIKKCSKKDKYVMFMIHSSELMPACSPNFKTKKDIERLYTVIDDIFKYSKKKGYNGITLREYYELIKKEMEVQND